MTLINGFEDIIAHIKNQEQKIMSLEEEHKQVKKENEELKEEKHKVIQDAYNTHYETWKKEQENTTITELKDQNYALEEHITDLKEENVKLQETLIEYLATIEGLYKQIEGE